MTREEFAVIVKGLKAVYTHPSFIPDKDAFNVWYSLLGDLTYQQASSATQKFMLTSSKNPTPADIREQCRSITTPEEMNEMSAWSLVSKALRNGIYGAQEEFDQLPETVKSAVGTPDNLKNWAVADENSVETVIQSQFLRSYRVAVARKKELEKLPPRLREEISKLNLSHRDDFERKAINVSANIEKSILGGNTDVTEGKQTVEQQTESARACL